jgi:hypothetical protein
MVADGMVIWGARARGRDHMVRQEMRDLGVKLICFYSNLLSWEITEVS